MELATTPMTERQRKYRENYRERVAGWYCDSVSSSRHSEPAECCPAEHVIALIRGEYGKDTLVGVV